MSAESPTHYERLGGEAGVRALVDRFYDLMELEPEFAVLRGLHGTTLEHARDKLFMFISGWTGGPPLFVERFGHPRLRQRHLPFEIDSLARDQWMLCMLRAMAELGIDDTLRGELADAFYKTADFMRNREG